MYISLVLAGIGLCDASFSLHVCTTSGCSTTNDAESSASPKAEQEDGAPVVIQLDAVSESDIEASFILEDQIVEPEPVVAAADEAATDVTFEEWKELVNAEEIVHVPRTCGAALPCTTVHVTAVWQPKPCAHLHTPASVSCGEATAVFNLNRAARRGASFADSWRLTRCFAA
jgi:hypothetical protein